MPLVLAVLSSGSKGNATYVGDGSHGLLVDCGISARQFFQRMRDAGLDGAPLDAVLVTHEHGDHVKGLGVLQRKLGHPVPFFMTPGTARLLPPSLRLVDIETVEAGEELDLGFAVARPFSVPHDAADPVAYSVDFGGVELAVITDLGVPTRLAAHHLRRARAAVLEFNHDLGMLVAGPYPWQTKQRIRGNHGHLSNEQAARFLAEHAGPELRALVLGHLSEVNNHPGRAVEAASWAVERLGRPVELRVGSQDRPLPPIVLD